MKRKLLYVILAVSAAAPDAAPDTGELLSATLIQAYRGSRDIYSDPNVTAIINRHMQEARAWDKDRLSAEFDLLWQAGLVERSELLQAAFYGAAGALFVLNPKGVILARNNWTSVLDAIEKSPPRSQIGLAQSISRVRARDLSSEDLARMVDLAFAIEPFAGDFLVTAVATADPGFLPLQQRLLTLLDAHAAGTLAAHESGKIHSFLVALSTEPTASEAALSLLGRIAATGQPSWRDAAMQGLKKSLPTAPEVVRSILSRLPPLAQDGNRLK